MKTEKKDARTALRLSHKQREEIDQLISEGKFKSLSQVVRVALQKFFVEQEAEQEQ